MEVRTPHRAFVALLLTLSLIPAASASAADTGTAGPTFTGATAPTGEKPQSKLWFNDGTWWGVLYNGGALRYEIYKLAGGTWAPTGTVVDTRRNMFVDALWDGTHLNVVSGGTAASAVVRYSRFSYDPGAKAYARDVAPVDLTTYGVEAAVLDRDGAGQLWATWTHDSDTTNALTVVDSQVEVAHAAVGNDAAWTAPVRLPGSPSVTGDDISAIVRYAGHVGVMYSDQDPASGWTFTFASHADGAPDADWQQSTALQGAELSDDHINLKALSNDPAGQVFAAVKTSLNTASDPLVKLLVLDDAGAWHDYNVFTVGDEPTRPQVEVDPLRRQVHVFASLGPCCTGGIVAVKTADLDAISFASGTGTTVLSSGANPKLNNVTLTKQPVSAGMSFLPVLASDDSTDRYWFNTLALPALPSPPATQPGGTKAPAPRPTTSTPGSAGGTPTATDGTTPLPSESGTSASQDAVLRLPRVTRLSVLPASFRRRGTIVFRLSRATPTVVRLERRGAGGRYVLVRRYVRKGHAGPNVLRINVSRLRPGRYRALVGVPGRKAVSASFRIGR